MRTGREVCVILHDIEVVGSLLAWRARDSNTLWHLTAVIVHGQGVVVGVYEQVVWPQCVKTRCEGRRVGDTGCLSAGGGEVNVCGFITALGLWHDAFLQRVRLGVPRPAGTHAEHAG